jgi:ribose transport system substrate-binding protein
MTEVFEPTLLPEITLDSAKSGKPVEKLTPLPDMTKYIQPPQRRIYSRGSCDEGWKPGPVMTGQSPEGLPGCVKE